MKKMMKIVAKILIISLTLNCQGIYVFANSVDDIKLAQDKVIAEEYKNGDNQEEMVAEELLEERLVKNEESAIDDNEEEKYEEEIKEDPEEIKEEPEEVKEEPEEEQEEPEAEQEEPEEVKEEPEEEQEEPEEEQEENENIEEENTEEENTEKNAEKDDTEEEQKEDQNTIEEVANVLNENPLSEEVKVEGKTEKIVGDVLFGGTKNVDETITIKFGNTPRFDKSTNWAGKNTGIAIFTENATDHSYSIEGNCGDPIVNSFAGTDAPIVSVGGKDHIPLPLYNTDDNIVWSGYKFSGWKDNFGNDLGTTFNYAYQYKKSGQETLNDIDYLPQWTLVENPHTVKIRYWRSTSSVATTTNAYKFIETTIDCNHGSSLSVPPADIQGYKPVSYIIKDESGNVVSDTIEISDRGFKEKNAYGEYYIKDSSTDAKMDTDFSLSGSMPNHNIEIEFFYDPDPNVTNDLTIYYKNAANNNIKDPLIISCVAETPVTAVPDFVIPNYNYKEAVVTTGTSTEGCKYPLGTFYLDGQILTPSNNTDTTPDKGKFYAYMPNQDVTITYKYDTGSSTQGIIVKIGTESVTGDISTISYVIPNVPVDAKYNPGQDLIIVNYEDKGFGSPIIDTRGVMIESYEGYSSSPRSDGVLKYYLSDFGAPEIDITYYCDFTKDFWSKVSFNTKPVADGGHGTIEAASGTKPLTERYFEKGKEYNVSALIAGITATPDAHYEAKWYECNTSMEPIGTAYNINTDKITLTNSNFAFFVAFEEIAADFADLSYTNADHCTLDGIMSTHIVKGTAKSNIASPSVVVDAGYKWEGGILVDATTNKYEGGIWINESGVAMPNVVNVAATYHPSIVLSVEEYAGAVKPISRFSFTTNGYGKVVPFGTYADRVYVLADADDKVIEKKNGNGVLSNGFTNLIPGHTYHLYECLSTATIPDVGEDIASVGSGISATISEKYVINVPALNGNYSVSGTSINVTARTNMQYALLNPNKTVAKNWGESFTGLTETTYYTVVARKIGETYGANSTMAIENGVQVFMETHDLTGRTYRIIVLGNTSNITVNGSTKAGQNTVAGPSGKVYQVNAGDTIKLEGVSGKTWEVVSNNVTLSSYTVTRPEFTMPSEDVVVRNFTKIADATNYSIEIVNGQNNKMGLADKETYAAHLQTDTNASTQAGLGRKVRHYVVLNKKAALSSTVGVVYEYTIEVGMTIQGVPYPYTGITALDPAKLNTYIVYEKEIQGNSEYSLVSETITYPYNETDEKLKGSGIIKLEENAKKLKYTKIQKVTVTSNIDTTYNKTFYVNNNTSLNTATNYSELSGKLADYWSPATNTSGNTFNDKEYLYEGMKDASNNAFDPETTNIKKDIAVKFYHNINSARETEKTLLNNEFSAANTKLTTLTSPIAIASLNNAINTANAVKISQRSKTVAEIHTAYLVFKQAVDTAVDPPVPPGTIVTITINANGGSTTTTQIYEIVGNQYTELANVVITRNGYTFEKWNTQANGNGTTITPTMTVSATNYPTVLYAIWKQNKVKPHPSGGGSGGGGGGGGGGRIEPSFSELPVLEQNTPVRVFEKNISNLVFGNSMYFKDNEHFLTFYEYQPAYNIFTLSMANKETGEKVKDQWATVSKEVNGQEKIYAYRFDEAGNARVGLYTEGNDVYYFSKTIGEDYASLQIGWIFDPHYGTYYYANPYTGALITGWTNVDGKDYYFVDTKSVDVNGKLNISNETGGCGYGQLLVNCITPDGYRVDATGARIIEIPGGQKQ